MYPRLIRRVQAVLIDSIITPVLLISCVVSVGALSIESGFIRGVLSFGPALSLEPLLVAITGGTIGHHLIGIKVRYIDKEKNISILHAYLRFFLKLVLGLPSLISILLTKRHQAIHDVLSQSIVVHKDTKELPAREIVQERITKEEGYTYPGAMRRIVVILSYLFLNLTIFGTLYGVTVSGDCLHYSICNDSDKLLSGSFDILYWGIFILIIIMGWKSRLFGCRRKIMPNN